MPLFNSSIDVLMCGGRRTGKTTIMAAMQREAHDKFSVGNIILSIKKNDSIIACDMRRRERFLSENLDTGVYYADDGASSSKEDVVCEVTLQNNYRSPLNLHFIDVPGEWFVDPVHRDELQTVMRKCQIIVIAVDSPHLVEDDGRYHDCFNRPEKITDAIKQAFQGDVKKPRLVLFVPVKCELYRNNGKDGLKPNMSDLLNNVKQGYSDLIKYLDTTLKDSCTVAVAPCITIGGLQFVTFVDDIDDKGNILPEFVEDPKTRLLDMTKLSEYVYLLKNGERYYEPEDCIQPLLYILLFFVSVAESSRGGLLKRIIMWILNLNNPQALAKAKATLTSELKRDAAEGYAVLNDPFHMV